MSGKSLAEGGVRLGIHAGQQHCDYSTYLAMWELVEDVGLDWASVFDHLVPFQADPLGPCFEGMTLLAAMAAKTSRIRCGMIVSAVTHRNPGLLAKMAATIDHISGGRLELGIGAGVSGSEHEQYGLAFPRVSERLAMLSEEARLLKALWTDDRTTFEGQFFTLEDALCFPKPMQSPHIPLWIGGTGERVTLRVVAESADGWNTRLMPEDEYIHKLTVLAAHCADVGRDPASVRKQLIFQAVLADGEADAQDRAIERAGELRVEPELLRSQALVGTPEQLTDLLQRYARLGVGDFLLFARPPADVETIKLFAGPVAAALREQPN